MCRRGPVGRQGCGVVEGSWGAECRRSRFVLKDGEVVRAAAHVLSIRTMPCPSGWSTTE